MAKKLSAKYYLKNTAAGTFSDVTTLYDGVNILQVSGFDERGKAINVYNEQWVNSQVEDFLITTLDTNNQPVIIRENVNLKVVFVVGQRYANSTINTQTVYDNFVNYMTNTDMWIASKFYGKQVHCVALDKVEPKSVKLKRGSSTYILGELTLHTLEKPSAYPAT